MSYFNYTGPARSVRRISYSPDPVVTTEVGPWFSAHLLEREGGNETDGGSPRLVDPTLIRYFSGAMGPVGAGFVPGNRIEANDRIYEIVSKPRRTYISPRYPVGWEVSTQDLADLYPFVGDVQEQGGTLVEANVFFNVFSPKQRHEDTGMYEDMLGEAPIEHFDILRINRSFVMGTHRYKILSVELDRVGSFCTMELRRSGING